MKKELLFIALLLTFFSKCICAQNTSAKKHLPLTAFWWNGGWDHYDANALKYLDEIIIFSVAPNPETGELFKFESNQDTGEITTFIGDFASILIRFKLE